MALLYNVNVLFIYHYIYTSARKGVAPRRIGAVFSLLSMHHHSCLVAVNLFTPRPPQTQRHLHC